MTAEDTTPDPDEIDPAEEDKTETPADAAQQSSDEGRFGTPGPPLDRRNPFYVGFVGGIGVLLAYAAFLGIRNAASILVLVFVAMFLAIGLSPAVNRIRGWGLPRGAAVAMVTLIGLALLAGGIYALVPPLVTQTGELINNIPDYITNLQDRKSVV